MVIRVNQAGNGVASVKDWHIRQIEHEALVPWAVDRMILLECKNIP